MAAPLLRLGTRLWREGRRDPADDEDGETGRDRRGASWTPESVQLFLEWTAIRAALARRRARWFTRLADATIVWREPGAGESRLLVLENSDVSLRATCAAEIEPPVPPGHRRSFVERHEAFTVARLDRLRVLTTELKRLSAAGAPVAVRFGPAPPIAAGRLASLLAWL